MSSDQRFALGDLRFSLCGTTALMAQLAREFQSISTSGDGRDPHLRFHSVDHLDTVAGGSLFLPLVVGKSHFSYAAGKSEYVVTQDGACLDVAIATPGPRGLRRFVPAGLQRAMHFNYLNYWERRAKLIIYDVFDYLAQSSQMPIQQSFVHASSMERNGKALVLLAWGGIGKTTSMLKLILEEGWRFLSDDLGVINSQGVVFRNPKKMQIYAYNLVHQPAVTAAIMNRRSGLDRMSWAAFKMLKGPKGVRRRVSAEDLFGADKVCVSAPLGQAVFLERDQSTDFAFETLEASELADRCTAVLIKEISPFAFVSCAVHGAGNHNILPSVGMMEERTRSILVSAFSRVPCHLVRIPLHAQPDDLAKYLRTILLK